MHNPNKTMCSSANMCSDVRIRSIRSEKHMANVRKVSYAKTFPKVTAQVAVPENLYEEPSELADNMYHRHSAPVVQRMPGINDKSFPSDIITETNSLQLTPKTMATKERKNSEFRALTPGASIVSATSLIMSGSPYLGYRSLEDVYISSQEYPFENLVFEGGGSKGMAYVGALQVLEDVGILKNIKRFAGASVGSMVASLAAIGVSPTELEEFLGQDVRKILADHSCGYCSLLPNLKKGFGWNPGKKMNHWFGEQLRERTGDCDITFKDILRLFGTEICIVVTNLNHMSVEYFHPKTTPNVPVRKAVKMSMALPGVFQVVRESFNGHEDVYVDGGLLCNYPIHAFDGWWLSMEPEDAFFKRLQSVDDIARFYEKSERFGTWNSKTLGIILYSNTETELMKATLSERPGNKPPAPPKTKLAKQRQKFKRKQQRTKIEHDHMVHVVGRFMKELEVNNLDEDSIINEQEFRAVFENSTKANGMKTSFEACRQKSVNLFPDDLPLLFGKDCEAMEAFSQIDVDNDGEITFQELMAFLTKRGVNLQKRFLGYARKEIRNLGDFVQTLQTALAVNVKRVYVEKRDIDRTIGIDTDYVESNDFNLESKDKHFLIESGRRAARAYLHEYIKKQNPEPVTPSAVTMVPELEVKNAKFDLETTKLRHSSSSSTISSYKSFASAVTPVDIG